MKTDRKLIVIDMQNDFIDGSLGTDMAQAIVPRVVKKAAAFDGEVIYTLDTHTEQYLDTQEGRNLPVPHCIKGTKGWELQEELRALCLEGKSRCYEKPTFGSLQLAEDLLKEYEQGKLDSVELAGLCTDICVISNALLIKAYMPELPVYVDASCCAGVTYEKHLAALESMRSCQIQVYESEKSV